MGKKAKGARTLSPPSSTPVSDEALKELRTKGDRAFAGQEYDKAIDAYSEAIKLLPDSHGDKPLFFSNKAACYIQQKRYKEAVRESSNALKINSKYTKALQRRATAHEHLQLYKDALSDVQSLQKLLPESGDDMKKMELRLRNALAGRGSNGGGTTRLPTRQSYQQQHFFYPAKCTFKGEVRMLQITFSMSYVDLLEEVKRVFPDSGPIRLKYIDQERDEIVLTQRADLHYAIQDCVSMNDQKLQQGRGFAGKRPNLKLTVESVENEKDVPVPPQEEIQERQEFLLRRQQQLKKGGEEQQAQEAEVIEVEEWVVEFANLFRELLHVDTDRRFDLQQLGWDKCQAALDQAIKSDKAQGLFDQAIERFKEMTSVGLNNWGMVEQYKMQKELDYYINNGGSKEIKANKAGLLKYLEQAKERFDQALSYKADHHDSLLSLAGLHASRAKIELGFYLPLSKSQSQADTAAGSDDACGVQGESQAASKPTETTAAADKPSCKKSCCGDTKAENGDVDGASKTAKTSDAEAKAEANGNPKEEGEQAKSGGDEVEDKAKERAVQREKLVGICKAFDAKKVKAVTPMFNLAQETYAKALEAAAKQSGRDPVRYYIVPQEGDKEGTNRQLDDTMEESPTSQVNMAWGNTLFEWSLILAGINGDWKTPLNDAVAKFRAGGAREEDIKNALDLHLYKDQFELPPKPAEDESKDAPKGLPSLPKKKSDVAAK